MILYNIPMILIHKLACKHGFLTVLGTDLLQIALQLYFVLL